MVAAVFSVGVSAYAATPSLSLSATSGDSVQISITGDASANATLFFNIGSSYGAQTSVLGTTDSSGHLTKTVTASALGLNTSNSVYVVVNGQQSSVLAWPASGTAPAGSVSLSQSSLTLTPSQATTVVALGNAGVYLMTNSSPSVANISINGTQITVTGSQAGSTSATICYNGTATNCASLSITVNAAGSSSGGVTFDNPNPSVAVGATLSVTIMTGGSSFFVSSNSNPAIMTYQLNNNSMMITGVSAGSAAVSICSANNSTNCGTLNITIGGATSSTSSNNTTTGSGISFSPANPSVVIGQNTSVTLGGAVTYFVSINSNPITTVTNISGNILTITGVAAGSTSLTVCAAGGVVCSVLPVTITATAVATTPAAPVVAATPAAPVAAVTSSASLTATIQIMQNQLSQLLLAIQAMQTQLAQLLATMPAATISGASGASIPLSSITFSGTFTSFLKLNSTGAEVTALQKKLASGGYYSGPITGTFGPLTEAAVKKFQEANGLDPAGYVGPGTRAVLNQ